MKRSRAEPLYIRGVPEAESYQYDSDLDGGVWIEAVKPRSEWHRPIFADVLFNADATSRWQHMRDYERAPMRTLTPKPDKAVESALAAQDRVDNGLWR